MASEERTEAATPRRRQEARKKGQVGKSNEVASALVILIGFSILVAYGPYMFSAIMKWMAWTLSPEVLARMRLTETNVAFLFVEMFYFCARVLAPLVIVLMVMGIISNVLQVGLLFSTHPITPNFAKLNPFQGFKRLFSLRSVQELFKSLIKIGIVGYISFGAIRAAVPDFVAMMDTDIGAMASMLSRIIAILAFKVSLALVILALLDYMYQKWEFEKSIKMTKQEIKDEYKQREGDPLIRSRIRQRQREIAMMRMMKEVPKADVVITNPVFLAIALKYDAGDMHAPQVVAKGAGQIAERIRDLAEENDVPILVDRPLAQSLYKLCDINEYVPPSLFRAVAEVLAYVYRLGKKKHSFGI